MGTSLVVYHMILYVRDSSNLANWCLHGLFHHRRALYLAAMVMWFNTRSNMAGYLCALADLQTVMVAHINYSTLPKGSDLRRSQPLIFIYIIPRSHARGRMGCFVNVEARRWDSMTLPSHLWVQRWQPFGGLCSHLNWNETECKYFAFCKD